MGLIFIALALASCGKPTPPTPADRAAIETDVGEAIFRHLYAAAPAQAREAARVIAVLEGEALEDSSNAFRQKFTDWGRPLVLGKDFTWMNIGQQTRIIHRPTGFQPLQLQITKIEPGPDGSTEAIGAWAFEDAVTRMRCRATRDSSGTWSVKSIDTLLEHTLPKP
jgi:hypothetical protein